MTTTVLSREAVRVSVELPLANIHEITFTLAHDSMPEDIGRAHRFFQLFSIVINVTPHKDDKRFTVQLDSMWDRREFLHRLVKKHAEEIRLQVPLRLLG